MSQRQPTLVRPPLATRQRVNNTSADAVLPTKRSEYPDINFTSLETAYMEEGAKNMQALENACRLFECAWIGCDAVLGSWVLLKRHVEHIHCGAKRQDMSGRASSSRPYLCHYASCQNRTFSDHMLLVEHVDTAHLESLKLRCPFGCKQPVAKLQALRSHLSSAHGQSITELPGARMRPPPPRRAALPELATDAPIGLSSIAQVKPCATFDATKVKHREVEPWADFAFLDEENKTGPFGQLKMPPDGRIAHEVRLSRRGRVMYDGVGMPKGDAVRVKAETVGYESWKRQFDEQAEAEQPVTKPNHEAKRTGCT